MAVPDLKCTVPGDLSSVDLTDPRTFQTYDLPELWRRLRAERPVHWHPPQADRPGFWVLTRHADVMAVYRDNLRFTSERGNVLATLLRGHDSAAGQMLAVTDGSRHRDLRNVMLRAFTPRALAEVADRVRENAVRLVGVALDRGVCDFARDVAEHIPITTICDLLRVPAADREFLLGLTKSALSSEEPDATDDDAVMARNELLLYFADLVEERRAAPGDDVISMLATCTVDGEPLSDDTIVLNCYSLIIGGDETSRLSMIGTAMALAEHPAQWAALRDGTVDVDTAVDELLRWTSPAMHFGRTAVEQLDLDGHPVRPGEFVTLWTSSANRDERVFGDPDVLRLDRRPNKHVTFGYGPHFCLGSHLGRVELAATVQALLSLVDDITVTGPVRWVHSNFLYGASSLPVEFHPARRPVPAAG
jgi:cytochrome P450